MLQRLLLTMALLGGALPALAQSQQQGTPEDRAACAPAVQKYCKSANEDPVRVLACLQERLTQSSVGSLTWQEHVPPLDCFKAPLFPPAGLYLFGARRVRVVYFSGASRTRVCAECLRGSESINKFWTRALYLAISGSLKRAAEGAGHRDQDASSDKTGDQIADPTAAERDAEEAH